MAVTVSGNRGLNFVGSFDISEIEENSKRVLSLLDNVKKQAAATGKGGPVDDSYRKEQLAIQKALADSRLAVQRLKEEQQAQRNEQEKSRTIIAAERAELEKLKSVEAELNQQYKKGKIALQEYLLEQKKIADAERAATQAKREAERTLKAQEKLQREAAVQAERNRKLLEKESSEYYKLTQALGKVRTEAKDVQAEMFRLEREGLKASDAYRKLEIRSKALTAQTGILDNGVKRIDASLGLHQRNVGNYGQAVSQLSPQFAAINNQLGLFGTSLDALAVTKDPFKTLATSMLQFGKAAIAFMLTPVGAIITALAGLYALISANKQTVVDFDAGLRGVQKTTNMLDEELYAFGDSIIALSNNLKSVSTKELLEFAQVAGQLGVKGADNILRFSETLAKLQTASDISGEEGATEIARLLTLTDGGVENVSAFGDEIVNLGNNMAATERQILANAESISQNTGLYKMGRQQVLAYAAATKATGLEAEVVGSSFSRSLGLMEAAVRNNSKSLNTFAALTGRSAESFKKAFKDDAAGTFTEFVRGLNEVSKSGGSVQGILEQVGVNAVRDQRVIATLATNGYGELDKALKLVGQSAGAMDKEFDTANRKLENVGKRIGIAWDNLVLSIENGQGVFASVGSYLGNEFADMLVSAKKGIDSFGVAVSVAKQYFSDYAPAVEKANAAHMEYASVFSSLEDAMKRFTLRDFLYTLEVGIPNAFRMAGAHLETFRTGIYELARFLGNTGPEIKKIFSDMFTPGKTVDVSGLKKIFEQYRFNAKENDRIILEDARKTNAQYDKLFKDRYAAASDLLKAGQKAAADNKELTPEQQAALKAEQDRVKAELEAIKAKAAAEKEAAKQRLEAQRALQAKIDELNNSAHRKELSQNEAEIQAVKDKYAKIRKEIEAFYKNSKNKGLKVDASGLAGSEQKEIDAITAKQEVASLNEYYGQQKKLYEQFEQYRADFGIQKAKERYGKELDVSKTYLQKLEDELSKLRAIPADKLTISQQERYKALLKLQKTEEDSQQQQQDKLLKSLQDYEQKRLLLTQEYERKRATLTDANAIAQLELQHQAELNALDDAHAETLQAFQRLFAGIEDLSDKAARQVVADAKAQLDALRAAGKISEAEYKKISATLKSTGKAIDDRLPQKLQGLAGDIRSLSSAIGLVNDGFGNMLNSVANVIQGVAQIKENLNAIKQAKANGGMDLFGSLSAGMGIAGGVFAAIGAVKGIADAMNAKEEARAQRAAEQQQYAFEMQVKQNEAIIAQLDRQLAIIKDMYGTQRLEEYKQAVITAGEEYQKLFEGLHRKNDDLNNIDLGLIQLTGINKKVDEEIAKYNAGKIDEYSLALTLDTAGLNDGIVFLDDLVAKLNDPLQRDSALAEFQQLLDKGLLDEATAATISSMIRLNDQVKETMNAIKEEAAGMSFDSLTDSLLKFFEEGKTAAADFSKFFQDTMRTAILNAFKRNVIETQLQPFYDALYNAGLDGVFTEEEKDRLAEMNQEITDKIKQQWENGYKDVLGDITDVSGASQNTLSGAIRASLTEETGGKLAGIMQGQFGLTKQQLVQLEGIAGSLDACYSVATQSANSLVRIDYNTRMGYESGHRVETKLDKLIANTANLGSSTSARDMGLDG